MPERSNPPDSSELEFDLERERRQEAAEDAAMTAETPLPLCLTHGASLGNWRPPRLSNIPPAPPLPCFSERPEQPSRADSSDVEPSPSEASLGLVTERVLPGSAPLISTFRPKPPVRVCYSLTRMVREERIYRPLPGAGARQGGDKKR